MATSNSLNPQREKRETWGRAATFFLVFLLGTWLHFAMKSEVASFVTRDLSATAAAMLINTLTPSAHVSVFGEAQLGNSQTSVSIATGCDGIDAMLLLMAAVLVFPTSWRRRIVGVVSGALFLSFVNVSRIASLWYCLRYKPSFFDTLHLTVGQTIVIMCAVAFLAVWTGAFAKAPSAPPIAAKAA